MRRIEPLPEAVRSSVRSGIILHDLTRVVEELIFNSLDAGATKVYIAVGVETCFVKVVDNGYGVDRDGLVLLGERYATSRHDDFHASKSRGNFGFHGEALSCIADVSLLEITTKAPGMPHGYRKVMKGCKCLHLGINDDNREVGTTVVVRDLFYNQPVRRKRMQSSPKKILHSIKKCVLRIALVHSTVSFRVADIESEIDLLRTGSSPSPLQLLASNFGIEASKHLHEIEADGSELTLSGYISGPFGILSMKALQYIYINSRFVCKGPIHKLLNQLANGFADERKRADAPQHDKRSRSQTCPTFILDLSCPKSCYEITFEPTKNLVEFKDWDSILHFIQKAVIHFWMESTTDDLLPLCEVTKKRQRTQQYPDPVIFPRLDKLKQMKDWDNLPASPESLSSYNTFDGVASELHKLKTEALVIHNTSNLARSCSSAGFQFETAENEQTHSDLQLSDHFSPDEDDIWKKELCIADISCLKTGSSLEPIWQEESFEADEKMNNLFMDGAILNNCHEFNDGARVDGHFQRSSQFGSVTQRSLPRHGPFSTSDVRFESESDDLGVPEKRFHYAEPDNSVEEDDVHHIFREILPNEEKRKKGWLFSKCTTLRNVGMNMKCLSPESVHFDKDVEKQSPKYTRACNSKSEWDPLALSPSIDTTFGDVDKFFGEDVFGSPFQYAKGVNFLDKQSNHAYSVGSAVQVWGQDESPVIRCKEFVFDNKFNDSFRVENNTNRGSFFPTCSKVLVDSFPDISDPFYLPLSVQSNKNKGRQIGARKQARRFSAPPFYRRKNKFSALCSSLKEMSTQKTPTPATSMDSPLRESIELKHESWVGETAYTRNQQASNSGGPLLSTPTYVEDSFCSAKKLESPDMDITEPQKGDSSILRSTEGLGPKKCEDSLESSWKWRNGCAESESGVKLCNTEVQDAILDIGSGILHLSHNLLVPNCISRSNLEEARVLRQVDKKFIPVVAGKTLAIIDQHAADERIRLEELRKKVLSGESRQSTYLEAEQELVLPEIGYQLLQNYAEEIENWGWICRIDGEGSPSFSKNLNVLSRHQTTAKLVAVPCILGVNLTDVDLLEFLQQLADTDGSSTLPPSVHRVLNNKACRGAIMFGDTLLPSECSLIVEELARTTLCFQCAHGRPTTVPLVDLAMLKKQMDSLGCSSSSRDTREGWHGLQRHEISLARAAYRLNHDAD